MKTALLYAAVIAVHLLILLLLLFPRGGENNAEVAGEEPAAEMTEMIEEPGDPEPEGPEHMTYQVRRGENLTVIARRHGTTVAEIKSLNNLSGDTIHPGQELLVPVPANGSEGGG